MRTPLRRSVFVIAFVCPYAACGDEARDRDARDTLEDADIDSADTDAAMDTDAPSDTLAPPPAGPIDPTVATSVYDAALLLFSEPDPRQTGVDPGTLDPTRIAIVTGEVHGRDGLPLAGVVVTVSRRAEYGQTRSQDDGSFALAVNGGEPLVIAIAKDGFVPVQRPVSPAWQGYVPLARIALTPRAPVAVNAAFVADGDDAPPLVARGPAVSDADGARAATLLIPDDTTAIMVMPDGSTAPLGAGAIRITELTVGEDGPAAMPGILPAESGYTYAFEVAIDEAEAAGASSVAFSTPLPFYEVNFLGFPVGTAVPLGYYDRLRGVWVAEDSGAIVAIVAEADGVAAVDTDGDGVADDTDVPLAERRRLAELYEPGDELMRALLPHVTTWDLNWAIRVTDEARFAANPEAALQAWLRGGKTAGYGQIDPEEQVVEEDLPLTGVPFGLHYTTRRAPGYAPARTARVALDSPLPDNADGDLLRIDIEVLVAGRRLTRSLYRPGTEPPGGATFSEGQIVEVAWDGLDALGHALQGGQRATVRIGHVYRALYGTTTRFGYSQGSALTGNATRDELTLWSERTEQLGVVAPGAAALGGWEPSIHHTYDPVGTTLYEGNGKVRSARSLAPTIETLADASDGLSNPLRVMPAPDGSLTVAGSASGAFWYRVAPDGTTTELTQTEGGTPVTNATGRWLQGPAAGDDELVQNHAPATNNGAKLERAADGSYLFVFHTQVRRIARGPDGLWRVNPVFGVGSWVRGITDGQPALEASLGGIAAIAPHPDGGLLLSPWTSQEIWRVHADGRVRLVVASLPLGSGAITDLAVGPAGDILARSACSAWRVPPQGPAVLLANSLCPADAVAFNSHGLAVAPDGTIYFGAASTQVMRLDPDGTLSVYAGQPPGPRRVDSGDGGAARQAGLVFTGGLAVDAAGRLLIATGGSTAAGGDRVRRVSAAMPSYQGPNATLRIASEEATEVFEFDANGRHLRTLDALTGTTLWQFGYEAAGRLVSVADREGDVTSFERDPAGRASAIVGPDGDRTTLTIDTEGAEALLVGVTNPAAETTRLDYAPGGLLAAVTGARGNRFAFSYDDAGRVTRADDPPDPDGVQGHRSYARTPTAAGVTVTETTALGRVTTHTLERITSGPAAGATQRTVTRPDGRASIILMETDGRTTVTAPEGTVTTIDVTADPRFGIVAPVATRVAVDPPGDTPAHVVVASRAIEGLADPRDPFTFTTLTFTTSETNGTEADPADDRITTTVYTRATRTFVTTGAASAERTSASVLTPLGRLASLQIAGDLPTAFTYDAAGRPTSTTRGARQALSTFSAIGRLTQSEDPLGHTTGASWDAARRVLELAQDPDVGGVIAFDYDANGVPERLTTPAGNIHTSAVRATEQPAAITPPSLGGDPASDPTTFEYDADRQLLTIDAPGDADTTFAYDEQGRLATIAAGGTAGGVAGPTTFVYDALGRLHEIVGAEATVTASYDGALRLAETFSGAVTGTLSRTYDADHRIASATISGASGSHTTTLGYDADALLTSLAGDLAALVTRDPATGRITRIDAGASLSEAVAYAGGFGELSSQTLTLGAALYSVTYTRDALGRVTTRSERFGTGPTVAATYAYDALGRLVSYDPDGPGGAAAATYTFDTTGNRTFGPDTVIDAQDRLVSRPGTSYSYTAAGHLLTKADAAGTTTYTYDATGALHAVDLPAAPTVAYAHDGLGRRVQRVQGTSTRRWLYDPAGRVAAELDAADDLVLSFAYLPGVRAPFLMRKGDATYRLVTDTVGSVRLVVDVDTGVVAQRLDYDPFGAVVLDTSPGFQPLGFAAGLYDAATGLVRFGARDYDPATLRFTAKDPIGFAGGERSLYAYCGGDPVNCADPSGLGPGFFRRPSDAIDPYRKGSGHSWWIDEYTFSIGLNFGGGVGAGGSVGATVYADTLGSAGLAPTGQIMRIVGVDSPGFNLAGGWTTGPAAVNFAGNSLVGGATIGTPFAGPNLSGSVTTSIDRRLTGASLGMGLDFTPDSGVSMFGGISSTPTQWGPSYDVSPSASYHASTHALGTSVLVTYAGVGGH